MSKRNATHLLDWSWSETEFGPFSNNNNFLDQFKNQCCQNQNYFQKWEGKKWRHCVVHTFQILDCPPCSFWGYRKETTFSFLILFKVKNVFRWLCRQAREHFHQKSQNYRWEHRGWEKQREISPLSFTVKGVGPMSSHLHQLVLSLLFYVTDSKMDKQRAGQTDRQTGRILDSLWRLRSL